MSNVSLEAWLDALRCAPRECCLAYAQQPEYLLEYCPALAAGQTGQSDEYPLVYLHAPFCRPSSAEHAGIDDSRWEDRQLVDGYIDALEREIDGEESRLRRVTAVEIGGGMPAILPIRPLQRLVRRAASLLEHAQESNRLSICMTPRIAGVEADKIKMLSEAGVGRVAMRLQGPPDELAPQLGQRARESCAIKAVENIRAAGIGRLNIDLALGCPGQTLESWLAELTFAVQLKPDAMTVTPCIHLARDDSKRDSQMTLVQFGSLYDLTYDFLLGRGFLAAYGATYFSQIRGESGASAYFQGRQRDGLAFCGLGCFAESQGNDQWRFRRMAVDDYVAAARGELRAADRWRTLPLAERTAQHITDALAFGTIDVKAIQKLDGVQATRMFSDAFRLAEHQGWLKPRDNGHVWGVPVGQFSSIGFLKSLFYTDQYRLWLLRQYVAPPVLADAATFANAP